MHKMGVVWGHPRSSAMSPFGRAHTISYSSLIEIMHLSLPFSRYGELFVEIGQLLPTPPAFGAPLPLEVTPFEFRKDYWAQKARVPGLSCGVVCVFLCLAILVEHRLVTDRHRQTHGHGIYRESIARAVKMYNAIKPTI